MKRKIEKQIEEDILSSLPDNDLSFEKIENRIDYGRFATPKKKKSKAKFILIPLGAMASIAVLAVAIPIIIVATTPAGNGGGDSTNLPSAGTYEVSSVSGDNAFMPFEIGQKAEISTTTDITQGCLPFEYYIWGLEGRLQFIDGPLSEIDLDYEAKVSGNLIFSFVYSGLSYDGSIAFRSPLNEDPTITVTITNASEATLTLLFG